MGPYIGARKATGATGTNFFNGDIDEVSIYNAALSATRISALYTAATTAPSTAASGSASLTISASGTTNQPGTGSASLTISASGGAVGAASGSASLTFDASGEGLPPGAGAGDASLTISASGAAGASATGAASLTVSGSGDGAAVGAGSASLTISTTGSTGPLVPYVTAVLADSPSAYWRLGETSGTSAHDTSGNGHDGSYVNIYGPSTPALGEPGALVGDTDTAVRFPYGQQKDVRAGFWSGLNSATFTLEAWVNTTATSLQLVGREGSNLSPYHLTVGGYGFAAVNIYNGTGTTAAQAAYDGSCHSYSGATRINDGRWHHVVATRDASGTLSIYVDAVLDAQYAGTLTPDTAGTYGVSIGSDGDNDGTVGTIWGAGTVDEAAVYDHALTADRVATHYVVGHGATGGASLTLSASGTVTGASARGTAVLTFSASGQTPVPTSGEAFLELLATGTAVEVFSTDLSNALDGLDLLLTATVTRAVAVVAPPATLVGAGRYDKAVAYPEPVLVNGRPT
jgi:hypothetical protein